MGLLFGVGQTRPQFALDEWYGIEYDKTVSNPACTRIGKMDLHRTLPIQSKMRRCLLADDGHVVAYLDANDSTLLEDGTPADLTGASGMVMVELPDMYVKFEEEGNIQRVMMSEFALPGFTLWPKQYVSAYEAAIQRSTGKLASVVNMDADYRGGSNNAAWDGTYRSLLGRPLTFMSLANLRDAVRKRGSVRWNLQTYDNLKRIYWLYVIEYANRNSQSDFNPQSTSEGYHQGGLGAGVTTFISGNWSSYNSRMPFIPCGHTNSLGNNTGIETYNALNASGALVKSFNVPSYRGIENPFGHVWSQIDGLLLQVQTAAEGGKTIIYINDNPATFASELNDDYKVCAELSCSAGFISKVFFGANGDLFPSVTGGSNTTFFCDQHQHNSASANLELRRALIGGTAGEASNAGLCMWYTRINSAITGSYSDVGARLTYIPLTNN